MRKIIGIFVLLIALTACSSDESTTVNLDDQEPITTFKYLGQWSDKDLNGSERAELMEEQTGMPAEYSMLPVENGDEKLQLELSSNADYDMVQLTVDQFGSLSEQGALLDLRPYLEEYAPNTYNGIAEEAWNAVTSEDGAIYGIPRMGGSSVLINEVFIREDILNKEGYEVPTTTDELLTVTCGLAEKGYQTPWASGNATYNEISLRGAFGVPNEWNYDENNNLIHISQDDRYKQFLDFQKQMYDCGAMGNDYETITFDDAVQRFVSGDAVFFPGAYWNAGSLANGMDTTDADFYKDVAIVPSFEGPDGYKQTQQASPSIDNITAIPVYQEKYAVSILEYADKLNDPDWYQSMILGEEGTNYTVNDDGTINNIEYKTYENGSTDFGFSIGGVTDVIQKSTDSGVTARAQKLEDGEYQKMGAEGSMDYTLAVTDKVKDEYGAPNPIGMVIGVDDWTSNSLAVSNEMQDFSKLFVSGQKTDEDWDAFQLTMEDTYQLSTVSGELQDKIDQL